MQTVEAQAAEDARRALAQLLAQTDPRPLHYFDRATPDAQLEHRTDPVHYGWPASIDRAVTVAVQAAWADALWDDTREAHELECDLCGELRRWVVDDGDIVCRACYGRRQRARALEPVTRDDALRRERRRQARRRFAAATAWSTSSMYPVPEHPAVSRKIRLTAGVDSDYNSSSRGAPLPEPAAMEPPLEADDESRTDA